ncbi:MAG: CoA-transferase, partial [Candidatus Bathyarchaeia archaeon]
MDVIDEGKGELIGWCDPEDHREWVRKNKNTAMEEKVMSLKEAIAKFVSDGSYIAFGGFGHVRVSMAA